MDVILLSLMGFLLSATLLFLLIRNLEACIFWSALLAPAVGSGVVEALSHAISGNAPQALDSLKLLPFFLAAIDKNFFGEGTTETYLYVGVGFLAIWFYVLAHFAIKKFSMWALPMLPVVLWSVGLTLPNLRTQLGTAYPQVAFLFDFYGVPILVMSALSLFGICYFIWRRDYIVQGVPLPSKLIKGKT